MVVVIWEHTPAKIHQTVSLEWVCVWGGDFPGGPMVRNPLASAGDMGYIPGLWSEKIPHVWEQLSLSTANTDLCSRDPAPQQEKPLQ